jgi:PilZ domain
MSPADDRRNHPRANASIEVWSRLLQSSELPMLASSLGRPDPPIPQLHLVKNGGRVTHLATVNLSAGGLSAGGDLEIDAEKGYAKGADVVVEFDLKDGEAPVRAVAQVMWTEVDGPTVRMGLMFLLITDSAFMRIQNFVLRQLKS